MDLLGDFFAFCLDHGFGGLLLLALAAGVALVVLVLLVSGVRAAAGAFGRGWREAGEKR